MCYLIKNTLDNQEVSNSLKLILQRLYLVSAWYNKNKYKKRQKISLSKQIINKQLDEIVSEYFTAIEIKRKTAKQELIVSYPFIPYATNHILMELYMLNRDEEFEIKYIKSLELLKEKFKKMNVDLTNSLDIIAILKSDKLNKVISLMGKQQ